MIKAQDKIDKKTLIDASKKTLDNLFFGKRIRLGEVRGKVLKRVNDEACSYMDVAVIALEELTRYRRPFPGEVEKNFHIIRGFIPEHIKFKSQPFYKRFLNYNVHVEWEEYTKFRKDFVEEIKKSDCLKKYTDLHVYGYK